MLTMQYDNPKRTEETLRSYFAIAKDSPKGKTIMDARDLMTQRLGDQVSWTFLLYLGCQALLREHRGNPSDKAPETPVEPR